MIGIFFLLTLLWVRTQAVRGDFFDLDKPAAELIAAPDPLLLLNTGTEQAQISLEWLNGAAKIYQKLERWIIPAELRFSVRAGMLARDLSEQAHDDRLEREFYRNAGEV